MHNSNRHDRDISVENDPTPTRFGSRPRSIFPPPTGFAYQTVNPERLGGQRQQKEGLARTFELLVLPILYGFQFCVSHMKALFVRIFNLFSD